MCNCIPRQTHVDLVEEGSNREFSPEVQLRHCGAASLRSSMQQTQIATTNGCLIMYNWQTLTLLEGNMETI